MWHGTNLHIVTEQKLEIQLRVKIDSLYLTTPKHSGGAVNPAVQSLQLGQRIKSSPLQEY